MIGARGLTNQSVATYADGHAAGRHGMLFTGNVWYVDGIYGADTNSGQYPEQAFATIGAALAVVVAGDAIIVKAGTYDEGVDLNLDGLELHAEIGAILSNTDPGTVLTVSGDYCLVDGVHVTQAGQVGIHVTGTGGYFWQTTVMASTVGWDVDAAAIFSHCYSRAHVTTGFDIAGGGCTLHYCYAQGPDAATRGFYISNAASDDNHLHDCVSSGNYTAGFEIVAGADNNVLVNCVSGGGDGTRVDQGTRNFWPGFVDRRRREQHEHIYPVSAGQGVAGAPVTVDNSTTDGAFGVRSDQNYWGDIVRIVPPDTLTDDWHSLGIYIHSGNAAHIQQWQIFYTEPDYSSAQNGGNDWDENEVVLTVVDGSIFEANDLVWITGTDVPDGEIQKVVSSVANVVTVVRETTADGFAGLRYIYDVDPSTNAMYLVYRATNREFHGYNGDYETATARDSARINWTVSKYNVANGAMLMRMLNATNNNDSDFDVRAIYQD